jgi:hypothetical protein
MELMMVRAFVPRRRCLALVSRFCLAGACTVKWPSEKNKDAGNMACIVTVFGVAYFN